MKNGSISWQRKFSEIAYLIQREGIPFLKTFSCNNSKSYFHIDVGMTTLLVT